MRGVLMCAFLVACGTTPAAVPDAPATTPAVAKTPEVPAAPAVAKAANGACSAAAFTRTAAKVHSEPGRPDIGELPPNTEVALVAHRDGWVQINSAWNAEDEDAKLPLGWVKAELLTTSLKTPDEYGPEAKPMLWADPAGKSSEAITLSPKPSVTVTGCEVDQLSVQLAWPAGKKATGFLGMDAHCPSTVTSCS